MYYTSSNPADVYFDVWRPNGDQLDMVFTHLIEPNPNGLLEVGEYCLDSHRIYFGSTIDQK